MQPSKERDASDEGPLDDLDDLLDDDLTEGETAESGAADSGDAADSVTGDETVESTDSDGGRIGMSGRWFSAKSFAVVAAAVAVAVFLGGSIPLIGGTVGSAGGVFVAAFLVGLVFSGRKYVETGIAGAAAGAGTAVLNVLGIGFLPIGLDYLQQWGPSLFALGGGLGLAVALLGHYFGRDLRSGLSQSVDG